MWPSFLGVSFVCQHQSVNFVLGKGQGHDFCPCSIFGLCLED